MHLRSSLCLCLLLAACDDAGPNGVPDSDAPISVDQGAVDGGAPLDGGVDPILDLGGPDGGLVDRGLTDAGLMDAGLMDAAPPQGDGCGALVILEQRCAQGGCHLPNNRRTSLVLTRSAMQSGALNGYVAPGDPAASHLLDRMHGRGAGPLMPLGSVSPIAEVAQIEAWIADGASTRCDDPAPPPPSDPNHLDADALFMCAGADSAVTPARIRRIERREWTRAVVKPLAGTWWGSTAKDNPFAAPDRLPYSTWPSDVSVDPATLDLYMLVLPEAPAIWNTRDSIRGGDGVITGVRTEIVYRNAALRCMFDAAAPDEACIDTYVDTLLVHGVLFRAPTDGERARLRAFLVQALADEAAPGDRRATLQYVGEAAFLMTGALFRSELGAPDPDDPTRRRLTPDEMALALGRVLTAHPVGAAIPLGAGGPPDADQPALGRFGLIRQAADDGTIFDPAVIADLLAAYRGGVDAERRDLQGEEDDRRRPRRGEYWLAENIQQFFREWLGYEAAGVAFKDAPGATSQFPPGPNPMYDRTTVGFRNLQSTYYGYESSLVAQMDDTIARAVIDSHDRREDVFAKLLTTRTWRLPSNLADVNDVACADNSDCAAPNDRCSPIGLCGNSIAGNTATGTRVYDVDAHVPNTPAGRWVDMPADERAGVLTHPAWLAAHGGNFEDDASAVLRGRWIREQLFCETVPGLERVQAEAQLIASAPELSARERLHRSVEDPALNPQSNVCMGCHGLMNSLGMPFETFNHAGFVRQFDHGPGGDVLPSGYSQIMEAPEPALAIEVADPIELTTAIAASQVARRCFIRHTFRYFAGRAETEADACVLADMQAALDRSGSFFDMLEALVVSDAFQLREAP